MTSRPTTPVVLLGLLVLAAAGASLWLFVIKGDDSGDEPAAAEASLLSPDELSDLAGSAPGPIYWAGRQGNTGLEVTSPSDGSTFVRYLPPGVEAGDPRPGFLTVATYPIDDSGAALEAARDRPGAIELPVPGGASAVSNEDSPTSAYLVPSEGIEVEVYDPSAKRVAEIVRSGVVQPVP